MKITLLITTYNRPQYLEKCLASLMKAKYPKGCSIMIVDDASNNERTIELINEFEPGVKVSRFQNPSNSGIKSSLKFGFERAFTDGADLVINLDGDAIVKPEFITKLIELKKRHGDKICSGFNCNNTVNPILETGEYWVIRKHHNGINICINKSDYENYIIKGLEGKDNWDFSSTSSNGCAIACPSVVQHIGYESSMRHGNTPDIACDFYQLELPNVTLLGTDHKNPKGILRADAISQRDIKFGKTCIVTDKLYDGREAYSKFYIKELAPFITTSHVLIIHYDGYVLNWEAWDNSWLQYDYIGALWEWYKDDHMNGNGGFSLRSKKLLDILAKDEVITEFHPEDHVICRTYRRYLEKTYDIKFAPDDVCRKFSIEAYAHTDNIYKDQFGFHGFNVDFRNVPIALRPERFDFNKPIRR